MRSLALAFFAAAIAAACGGSQRTAPGPAAAPAPAPQPASPAEQAQAALAGGDLPVVTLTGEPSTLDEHRGDVTVIAVWATFCKPCIDELPMVEALHQRYRDDERVSVISVNVDDTATAEGKAAVEEAVDDLGLTLPVLLDREHAVATALADDAGDGRRGLRLPLLAVVDAGAKVHRRYGFPIDMAEREYVNELAHLVDLALAGRLPDEPRQPTPVTPEGMGGRIEMQLPDLSDEEIATLLPQLREQLAYVRPDLTDAQLDELVKAAEQQMRSGGKLELDLPPAPP